MRRASTAPHRWEVVRIYADGVRANVTTTHKSADYAERHYNAAVALGIYYAVDVNFLPHGRVLDFEPLYGVANGFAWVEHDGGAVYADEALND